MSGEWWGFIFLMLIMKIPIAYLAAVVWYACKPPDPPEPAVKLAEVPDPSPLCPWRLGRRSISHPFRPRPNPRHTRPTPRVSHAFARHE
jgi:hypothetical protein